MVISTQSLSIRSARQSDKFHPRTLWNYMTWFRSTQMRTKTLMLRPGEFPSHLESPAQAADEEDWLQQFITTVLLNAIPWRKQCGISVYSIWKNPYAHRSPRRSRYTSTSLSLSIGRSKRSKALFGMGS